MESSSIPVVPLMMDNPATPTISFCFFYDDPKQFFLGRLHTWAAPPPLPHYNSLG